MTTQVPDTTPAELDRTVAAAAAAARELAASTPRERADRLDQVAGALEGARDELVELAGRESHLPAGRLTGELTRTTFQLRLLADVARDGAYLRATIDHADPSWGMGARPDLRRVHVPLGPVAVYAASNFPFAFSVAGGDTAAALAVGCPVLLKAHPGHPVLSRRTGELVVDALSAAGAPAGTFAVVHGLQAGRDLVVDPRIKAASFTGSLHGGRALFDLAASRPEPIPFFGELGSLNPVVVTSAAASARAPEVAVGFVDSVTLGTGQFCTKPGFLLVPSGSPLASLVADAARERPSAPMLNAAIAEGYTRTRAELAAHPAAEVLVDGGDAGPDGARATVLRTSARSLVADADALLTECFGPTAVVVEYDDLGELLDAVRAFSGQLTATVHAEGDEPELAELVPLLAERAGRVLWNGWPTGVSVTYAQQHGGPYPATTSVQHTSVGAASVDRFVRPVAYQDAPQHVLPPALQDDNPWALARVVDGVSAA